MGYALCALLRLPCRLFVVGIRVQSRDDFFLSFLFKIVLTACVLPPNLPLPAALRGSAALAGKNISNRWRGWRDSRAVRLNRGCGCFQSLLWAFPGGKGCKSNARKRIC